MPGFGSGPFGGDAFGEFDWSREVLFKSQPELHREADNGLYELYADALGISYDALRRKIREFGTLRDPLLVRTQYDEVLTIKLGKRLEEKGVVEQRGVSARVDVLQNFVTVRGRFTQEDLGKELEISGSAVPENNRTVRVARIVTPRSVATDPPLLVDPGELTWSLRTSVGTGTDTIVYEVSAGNMDLVAPGWLLSDGRAEVEVLSRTQFLQERTEQSILTDREGQDGFIAAGVFTSPTLNLTQADLGRRFTIAGSVNAVNNGKFSIAEVLSPTTMLLDSTDIVSVDAGPLTWAILKRPRITVNGPSILFGVVEQDGVDGETDSGLGEFASVSATFDADSVGKVITIRKNGSAANGNYEITALIDTTRVAITPSPPVSDTGFFWELRTETNVGDGTELTVRATSLIRPLAEDFAIPVDTREDEEFQRRWVASVSRWTGLKGTEDGYEFLAALTGFEIESIEALYRISLTNYNLISVVGNTYIVGEAGAGRSGLDGSLTDGGGGLVQFSAPTAEFVVTDIGRIIHVTGSGSGNDGIVGEIATVDSATQVTFVAGTAATVPDANNGTLEWMLAALYSAAAPELPKIDEINTDRMTELKGATAFAPDKFCFEPDWSTTLGPGDSADGAIFVEATLPALSPAIPIEHTVLARGDFDVISGIGDGRWQLTDSLGNSYFLETKPELRPITSSVLSDRASITFVSTGAFDIGSITTVDAAFVPGDVGRNIRIRDGANVSDGDVFAISGFVSATEVDIVGVAGTIPLSEPNNGNLTVSEIFVGEPLLGPPQIDSPTDLPFTATDEYRRIEIIFADDVSNIGFNAVSNFQSSSLVDLDPTFNSLSAATGPGSIGFEILRWEFTVVATQPPQPGAATLEYICAELTDCAFCKTNKVRIQATTTLALEKGSERLRSRIEEVRPAHVEIVEAYGVTPTAPFTLTATVTTP